MKLYKRNGEWFYEGRHFMIREQHLYMLPVRWIELWRIK